MKSIIKLIGLLSLLTLLVFTQSSKIQRSHITPPQPNKPNYVASKSKVKYDYNKIDKDYKDEALKQNKVDDREKKLYEYTIRKVFKIYAVEQSAVDVCYKALKYPNLMHLMLLTFNDRSKDNTNDEFYLKHVKLYPPACLEPLHKMKEEMPKKVNELKEAVYQFKKVQRRLRRLRKEREEEDKKKNKNKKKNKKVKQ